MMMKPLLLMLPLFEVKRELWMFWWKEKREVMKVQDYIDAAMDVVLSILLPTIVSYCSEEKRQGELTRSKSFTTVFVGCAPTPNQ
jgi:hypothetical protein